MKNMIKAGIIGTLAILSLNYMYQRFIKDQTRSTDHLYIMYDTSIDLYKIGRSKHPKQRVKEVDYSLDGTTDGNIVLISVFRNKGYLERKTQDKFKMYQVLRDKNNGGCATEWYQLTEWDINKIKYASQ